MRKVGDAENRRSHRANRLCNTGDYPIGYGRPPAHTRFKPGQSGNPKGRPKSSKNLRTIIEHALTAKIVLRQGQKRRSISTLEGIVRRQVESALKGNDRAALATLKMAAQVGLLEPAHSEIGGAALSPVEKEMMDELLSTNPSKTKAKIRR